MKGRAREHTLEQTTQEDMEESAVTLMTFAISGAVPAYDQLCQSARGDMGVVQSGVLLIEAA